MSADRFTKVTHQSFGKNILNSFVGAIIGILLFLGSFAVLWMNEGKINWAKVADTSTPVQAATVDGGTDGTFVAVTGNMVSGEQIGDAPYLKPGAYLKLERRAEMFAWQEKESSKTEKELGGGSTTTTTYEYVKGWTSSPESSSSFEYPQGHTNPSQKIKSEDWTVADASIGAYRVETSKLEMPGTSKLNLSSEVLTPDQERRLSGEYIFIGSGTPNNPEVGDIRIQYYAVPNNTLVTGFGTQRGSDLVPYTYRGESQLYRAIAGDRASAISQLQAEHNILTWVLRLAGFLMMWIGMGLVFGPITAFMNILPFLGNLSGFAIGAGTFVVALVLSILTILISIIMHSVIALSILLALILGGLALWGKLLNRPKAVPAT